jgi:hypothetical protein
MSAASRMSPRINIFKNATNNSRGVPAHDPPKCARFGGKIMRTKGSELVKGSMLALTIASNRRR